jgi:hypothetical protein
VGSPLPGRPHVFVNAALRVPLECLLFARVRSTGCRVGLCSTDGLGFFVAGDIGSSQGIRSLSSTWSLASRKSVRQGLNPVCRPSVLVTWLMWRGEKVIGRAENDSRGPSPSCRHGCLRVERVLLVRALIPCLRAHEFVVRETPRCSSIPSPPYSARVMHGRIERTFVRPPSRRLSPPVQRSPKRRPDTRYAGQLKCVPQDGLEARLTAVEHLPDAERRLVSPWRD